MYIVISGGGKVGSYLAMTLHENGHNVTVIEANAATALRLAKDLPNGVMVLEGDGCDSIVLQDADCQNANIFVSTTGRDDNNLVSCELAKTIFGVDRCIARVNNPRNERIFRRMGIESVSSTMVISTIIETEATAGEMKAISSIRRSDVTMIEMRIPGGGPTPDQGVRISDMVLPKGSLVAAVHRRDGLAVVAPDTKVYPGEDIIVLCEERLAGEVREIIQQM